MKNIIHTAHNAFQLCNEVKTNHDNMPITDVINW